MIFTFNSAVCSPSVYKFWAFPLDWGLGVVISVSSMSEGHWCLPKYITFDMGDLVPLRSYPCIYGPLQTSASLISSMCHQLSYMGHIKVTQTWLLLSWLWMYDAMELRCRLSFFLCLLLPLVPTGCGPGHCICKF